MIKDSNFAPYGPPENIERIIDRIRSNGPPDKFNNKYLEQLGITDTLWARNLQAVEFIGLSADGAPTQLAEDIHLGDDQQWRARLQQALRVAYADIFKVVDPETAARGSIDHAFRPKNPKSQRARQVTLFLGLCQLSGMAVREPVVQRSGQDEQTKKTKETRTTRPRSKTATSFSGAPAAPSAYRQMAAGGLHPALAGIIAAVPELETKDDLDRWIESFRATFTMIKKIKPDS